MSELTDELEYIFDWLVSLDPDFVDCYNPGLTRQKIDEIIKELPYNLSEEIYELYQWRNGFAFDYNLPLKTFFFLSSCIVMCQLHSVLYKIQFIFTMSCE